MDRDSQTPNQQGCLGAARPTAGPLLGFRWPGLAPGEAPTHPLGQTDLSHRTHTARPSARKSQKKVAVSDRLPITRISFASLNPVPLTATTSLRRRRFPSSWIRNRGLGRTRQDKTNGEPIATFPPDTSKLEGVSGTHHTPPGLSWGKATHIPTPRVRMRAG
jgi:hypothetical protein